ncbi:MAG: hypothetical protein ACP5KA_03945 [Desulfurococcaceae archaeon]
MFEWRIHKQVQGLSTLLEAHVTSRYGDVEYSQSGAEPCSSLARGLVGLLEEACRSVKLC